MGALQDIASLEDRKFRSFETLESILSLARKASDLFVTQSFDEQARLIRLVETNATWDGVTLSAIYKKPFSFFAEGLKSSSGGVDDPFNQTFLQWAEVGLAA